MNLFPQNNPNWANLFPARISSKEVDNGNHIVKPLLAIHK